MPPKAAAKYVVYIACLAPVVALALTCPEMPEQTKRDWNVEVQAAVGRIGTVKAGELESRVRTMTQDLLGKLPDASRVYLEQMLFAAYCSALREDKQLTESEKARLIADYTREVRKALASQAVRANDPMTPGEGGQTGTQPPGKRSGSR